MRSIPYQLLQNGSAKRRCTKISRLMAKLGGHGLIAKVKDARLYRLTPVGSQTLFAEFMFLPNRFP
jgi:hypothetical protein